MSIPSLASRNISQISNTALVQVSNSRQYDDLPTLVTKYLNFFTEAEHIQYESDYAENFPEYDRAQYIRQIQADTGFIYQPSLADAYLYTGDDPGSALNRLINHKPLLLDCRLAKDLAILLAILDDMGLEKFNDAIKVQCNGQLSLSLECCQKLLGNKIVFKDFIAECLAGKDNLDKLANLKVGDIIYIMIPEAKLVHPCSDYIGYHLICTGFNFIGKPLFLGFASAKKEAEPIEYYINILTNNLSNNLSYNDLLYIYKNRFCSSNLEFISLNYSVFFAKFWQEALSEFRLEQLIKYLRDAINLEKAGNIKELSRLTSYQVPTDLANAKCKLISITRL